MLLHYCAFPCDTPVRQTVSGLANDEDWDIHRVADRVNGVAEDQVFKTAVTVSTHYDQVRNNLTDITCDFAAGAPNAMCAPDDKPIVGT